MDIFLQKNTVHKKFCFSIKNIAKRCAKNLTRYSQNVQMVLYKKIYIETGHARQKYQKLPLIAIRETSQ